MIKGLPQLFIKRDGGVFVEYKFVVDDDFEQKERTLKKKVNRLFLGLKEKKYKRIGSFALKGMIKVQPLSKSKNDPYCKIYSLKEEAHDVPPFEFIRQIDRKAKIDPNYFE